MNDYWDGYHGRNMGMPRSLGEAWGRDAREREIREAREKRDREEQEAAAAASRWRSENDASRYTPLKSVIQHPPIDAAEVARLAEEHRRWEKRQRLPWIIGLSGVGVLFLAMVLMSIMFELG